METVIKIGSFEAKTKLSEYLRDAEKGHRFVILRRGKPVAELGPYQQTNSNDFTESFCQIRNEIQGTFDFKSLIEEGRK